MTTWEGHKIQAPYENKNFCNNLVAIHLSKVTLTLSKPAYVGICIMDLNKVLLYGFHDNYIKSQYGNNSRLLFTYIYIYIYIYNRNVVATIIHD